MHGITVVGKIMFIPGVFSNPRACALSLSGIKLGGGALGESGVFTTFLPTGGEVHPHLP